MVRFGLLVGKGSALARWLKKNHLKLVGKVKTVHKKPAPQPVGQPKQPVEMYDDISPKLIPLSAVAVAGYVDGKWPTYAELVKEFPAKVHKVSVAVFARDLADTLDIEPGDATIVQAAGWVKRERAAGNKKPILYTSVAWAEKLVKALTLAGFEYGVHYRLWTAHYTGKPHLCSSKCGFGFTHVAHATQWTDKAGGKSLDESLVAADFFPAGSPV